MQILNLSIAPDWIPFIAQKHFQYWGPLTGADTVETYTAFLQQASCANGLPSVLVARMGHEFLGSANLVACDCRLYPQLTPWLAQLFVEPSHRGSKIGTALTQAIIERAAELKFTRLFLYASGSLPNYYARLGWIKSEEFFYLGKSRTLMAYTIK